MTSIGVAFITHCSKKHLPFCLPPVLESKLKPRVCVVNSSSEDGTVELAQELGAETIVIPRSTFNHGTTREMTRKALGTDIVVMMTPDAYFTDPMMLEKLLEPLQSGDAALAYARQIPHEGAGFFARYARRYNYPEKSHVRSIEDLPKYGVYLYFCSDSCCAYLNQALEAVGGFPAVLMGEDTIACAKLLHAGYKVAYAAESLVKHSHDYTLLEEFKRHFDTGLYRKEYEALFAAAGGDASRGREYVIGLFRSLILENPLLLPYAFIQTAAKWGGYQIGKRSVRLPSSWKKIFSSQDYYWPA